MAQDKEDKDSKITTNQHVLNELEKTNKRIDDLLNIIRGHVEIYNNHIIQSHRNG